MGKNETTPVMPDSLLGEFRRLARVGYVRLRRIPIRDVANPTAITAGAPWERRILSFDDTAAPRRGRISQ